MHRTAPLRAATLALLAALVAAPAVSAAGALPTYASLKAAQRKAPFRIAAVTWLPHGLGLTVVSLLLNGRTHQRWAMISYGRSRRAPVALELSEAYGRPDLTVGAPRRQIRFDGHGAYLQAGNNGAIHWRSLAWRQGPYTFILTAYSAGLRLSTLEKVASSVRT